MHRALARPLRRQPSAPCATKDCGGNQTWPPFHPLPVRSCGDRMNRCHSTDRTVVYGVPSVRRERRHLPARGPGVVRLRRLRVRRHRRRTRLRARGGRILGRGDGTVLRTVRRSQRGRDQEGGPQMAIPATVWPMATMLRRVRPVRSRPVPVPTGAGTATRGRPTTVGPARPGQTRRRRPPRPSRPGTVRRPPQPADRRHAEPSSDTTTSGARAPARSATRSNSRTGPSRPHGRRTT